ncbi:phosphoribosyltransferase [uncultured Schumannella sp.]|uniref:phosphoribosyltransferase n=1 Tax=uncultured Schumannella sp. TaxID=1195956 RepID=UPI0025E52EDD|nr:phosphoribosyltransferase family protein [uncultured Schumannella sp.]
MTTGFRDRVDAGHRLAAHLRERNDANPVVLGLPRGGVPVAAEVATALGAPLDVIVVRKLGVPYSPEVAMGAIGEGGVRILDADLVRRAGVTDRDVAAVERAERRTLDTRAARLRGEFGRLELEGKTAIIVDDGIATGATASAACRVARALGARRVVLAAPVGGPDAAALVPDADEVICLLQPRDFHAVGAFYRDFGAVSDSEVVALLRAGRRT